MIPFLMMALSLAQKKQQQDQADDARISNSLNLDAKQNNTQFDVPNGNTLGNVVGGQGGALGLLGSLFNKKDPTQTGF